MTHIRDVADTAFLTAYARARESERDDALFRDPLASRLLTQRGRELGEKTLGALMMGWSIVIRTVLIDEMIASAVAGGIDLVVNLGAGLDTRPYRMDLPATLTWLEVDQESIIAHKNERLAEASPRCRLDRIPANLTDVPQRREVFAEIARRGGSILVLTEGVVPYWPIEAVAGFAEDLRSVDAVGGWIVDHIPPHVVAARRAAGVNSDNAALLFDPPDWRGFFARHGWRPTVLRNLFDEGARVGRPMPLPPGTPIVAADAATRSQSFPGYALLEPDRRATS